MDILICVLACVYFALYSACGRNICRVDTIFLFRRELHRRLVIVEILNIGKLLIQSAQKFMWSNGTELGSLLIYVCFSSVICSNVRSSYEER